MLEPRVGRLANLDLGCHALNASGRFILSDAVIDVIVLEISVVDIDHLLLRLAIKSEGIIVG